MKVRCIDASDYGGALTVGKVYEVTEYPQYPDMWFFTDDSRCSEACAFKWRFETVTDEAEAPAEQPKVDPYEARRLKLEAMGLHECDMRVMTTFEQPGATARLHAGLESEKVRERVKPWPHPARNPR